MAKVLRKYAYLSNTERSYLLQIYLNIKRICNKKKQHNTRKEKKDTEYQNSSRGEIIDIVVFFVLMFCFVGQSIYYIYILCV